MRTRARAVYGVIVLKGRDTNERKNIFTCTKQLGNRQEDKNFFGIGLFNYNVQWKYTC